MKRTEQHLEIIKQLNTVSQQINILEDKLTKTYYKHLCPHEKYEKVYKIINAHLNIIATVNYIMNER